MAKIIHNNIIAISEAECKFVTEIVQKVLTVDFFFLRNSKNLQHWWANFSQE